MVFDSIRGVLHRGDNTLLLLLTLVALVAVLMIVVLIQAILISKQSRRIGALARGADGASLEETLGLHMQTVEQSVRRMEALEQAVGVLQAKAPNYLQRIQLHRYDAFDDVGGEQSFSLALLDQGGDGVIITSVYSRMDVRVYAKAIQNGRASHTLSQEEEKVLRDMP